MTEQWAIFTSQAPAPFPVFSQAIVRNDTVYCSGMVGLDNKTGALVSGGVASQTDQLLRNLGAILEEAKSGLQHVLKVNVYITSMEHFSTMNEVYQKFFSAPMPARTCVAVKELPLGALVEMECVAFTP
ncbi:yabJ protein [Aspergillus ibericus CBS 121593]|uniref:YabJ protein n=1 Tax=Aspergillus ibericus CBS 121593 TaxID=1448316 RepID=A0A395GYS0_9EURO|nr:yabJ protein [Aspergillus ibericus CBS 121593]RAL00762.1 yabJ protein [Aspergillus ibericus CBS 121593]